MTKVNEQLRRQLAKEAIRAEFENSFEERVDRYVEVQHQGMVPSHHFAAASSECLNLYRDGYFLSTVMVSQSVAEGIFKFILERNGINKDKKIPQKVPHLVDQEIISRSCGEAFVRIWNGFRNDVHHMNPEVVQIPFEQLARRNISDPATIENEIFGWRSKNGKIIPIQAKYWDLQPDGSTSVFLRFQ